MPGQIIVVERPRRGLFAGVRSWPASWRALWRREAATISAAPTGEARRPRLRAEDGSPSECATCAACVAICPSRALAREATTPGAGAGQEKAALRLDLGRCIGCGLCVDACPEGLLELVAPTRPSFGWALSPTGPMSSAEQPSLLVDLDAERAARGAV